MVTVGAALLAIYGYDWVHRVFRWTLYILLPLVAVITIGVITGAAGGVASHHVYGFNWTGFMAQLSAAAAYNITYAGYVSDYSRYLPRNTPRGKIIGYVFAGGRDARDLADRPGCLAGHQPGRHRRPGRPADGGQQHDQPPRRDHRVPVSIRAGRDHGHERLRRHADDPGRRGLLPEDQPDPGARIITIVVLTVIWFVIGKLITTSAVGVVDTVLTLMLYLLVPWTVTNLIDFFFVRHGHYSILDIFKPNGIYGVWSYRGLIAYAAGFVAEIPFMVLPGIAGFIHRPAGQHI